MKCSSGGGCGGGEEFREERGRLNKPRRDWLCYKFILFKLFSKLVYPTNYK